ncbi:MAG TPA: hypothetical protein VFX22_11535 [Candidatus Kapabacteria bacterium]|nr:hypothetical protein [Candidatus Kapabacteria bacterium]
MTPRKENEKKFKEWEELPNGGRRYRLSVPGQRPGWSAHYVKEVDKNEETVKFRQEIYDDKNELVEVHSKYPFDAGHLKVKV